MVVLNAVRYKLRVSILISPWIIQKSLQILENPLAAFKTGRFAQDVLESADSAPLPMPVQLDVVEVTPADLGFSQRVQFGELCDRALSSGLEYCSREVVLPLRVRLDNQPRGTTWHVAMRPIRDSGGDLSILVLLHPRDQLEIGVSGGAARTLYAPTDIFFFVRSKTE